MYWRQSYASSCAGEGPLCWVGLYIGRVVLCWGGACMPGIFIQKRHLYLDIPGETAVDDAGELRYYLFPLQPAPYQGHPIQSSKQTPIPVKEQYQMQPSREEPRFSQPGITTYENVPASGALS